MNSDTATEIAIVKVLAELRAINGEKSFGLTKRSFWGSRTPEPIVPDLAEELEEPEDVLEEGEAPSPAKLKYNLVPTSSRFTPPQIDTTIDRFEAESKKTDELLAAYKRGDKEALNSLYGLYQGQIDRLVTNQANRRVPDAAVRAQTYIAFKKAVDSFQPGGKSFYNHFVDNHFRGVRNYFRPYSNFGKVTAARASNLDAVTNIQTDLELELGREPTKAEIVDEYRNLYSKTLSGSQVSKMLNEIRGEHRGSQELDDSYLVDQSAAMYAATLRARDTFPKQDYKLFNAAFVTPLEGGKAPTQRELSQQFGITTSTLNRKIQNFRTAIQREHNVLSKG